MLKSILNINGVQQLNKNEQSNITGKGYPDSCPIAISIDGTSCLCLGWFPNGSGTCSPGYR